MISDNLISGGIIFACIVSGMFLGAWFASRGFEKSLVDMMEETEESEKEE